LKATVCLKAAAACLQT